jgi:hypothetical protein
MEVLTVILLAVLLLGIGMAGMAIKIFVKRGGRFPNTHVSGNKYLKDQGVHCWQTQEKIEQQKAWRKVKFERLKLASDIKTGK